MSVLLKNAHLVSPGFEMRNASIELDNGLIRKIYPAGEKLPTCSEEYDATGKLVVPGLTHFHQSTQPRYQPCQSRSTAIVPASPSLSQRGAGLIAFLLKKNAITWTPPSPVPRLALHSQPASAAQSSALRNPAYAPRPGGGY